LLACPKTGDRSSYMDRSSRERGWPSIPKGGNEKSVAPSMFIADTVLAVRGPAHRKTRTSIQPMLSRIFGEHTSGASSAEPSGVSTVGVYIVANSLVSSFSNFHGRAIIEPSFCFSSFCRTRKSTTEWRSDPFLNFKSCLLRLHWYTPSTKTYIEIPGAMNRSEVRWIEKDCGLLGTGTKVSTNPSP
jgi:hypothetical protein